MREKLLAPQNLSSINSNTMNSRSLSYTLEEKNFYRGRLGTDSLSLPKSILDIPYSRLSRAPMRSTRIRLIRLLSTSVVRNINKLVLSLDNIILLVFNASIATPDASERDGMVEFAAILFAGVYILDVVVSFFALGQYWWRSIFHHMDLLAVLTKLGAIVYMLIFGKQDENYVTGKESLLGFSIPFLMVITSFRLMFLPGRSRYMNKIADHFDSDNMDLEEVRERIRSLPDLTVIQLGSVERLLERSAMTRDRKLGPQEQLTFLHLIGKNLPRSTAALIAEALSTRSLVVKIIEGKNLFVKENRKVKALSRSVSFGGKEKGKPYCVLTLRNAQMKRVSVLKDRVLLTRTKRRTASLMQKTNGPKWNESFLFEGIPSDVAYVRIDVFDYGLVGDTKLYTLAIPLSILDENSADGQIYNTKKVEKWFTLAPKDSRYKSSRAKILVKLYFRSEGCTPSHSFDATEKNQLVKNRPQKAKAYGIYKTITSTFRHWAPLWKSVAFGFLVLSINAAAPPLSAIYVRRLVDEGLTNHDIQQLLYCCIALVGLYGVSMMSQFFIGFVQADINAAATERLRGAILRVALSQDSAFWEKNSKGSLGALFASDVARINSLWIAVFWNLLAPIFSIAFAFFYLFNSDPNAGLMGFGFITLVFSGGPKNIAAEKSRDFSNYNAIVNSDYVNAIGCQKIIRSYRIQTEIMKRFNFSLRKLRWHEFASMFWSSNMQQFIETILNFFILVQTIALALLTYNDTLTTGDFFALNTLYASIVRPASALGGFSRWALGNAGSLQRIDELLAIEKQSKTNDQYINRFSVSSASNGSIFERQSSLEEGFGHRPSSFDTVKRKKQIIVIEDLVFRYKPSLPTVINGFSATINRGSYVCMVGGSGSGKSTILSILMGFQRQVAGNLVVDSRPIRNTMSIEWLQDQIGVVFQEIMILNGTIMENIRFGSLNASDEACETAANHADCDFIRKLKDGFNTVIGDNSEHNLSGGQMQRICLARALVRMPKILLLDEATSALDSETEAKIIRTLERLASPPIAMTIVSVTHRLSTTLNADKILVLQYGRVVEKGRYQDLILRGGLFAKLVASQEGGGDQHDDDSDMDENYRDSHQLEKIEEKNGLFPGILTKCQSDLTTSRSKPRKSKKHVTISIT